ncbi:hypothetical protein CDAR_551721 [Caerostris darwini]|uniref:Uncharacterized protein n=1 Tax=Caerostris darwini TaxID=1538125 RepID=A0AAV4QCN8_9ARAC|nr:hypothetical protein CDAR_551721 [Caerostris darwini]
MKFVFLALAVVFLVSDVHGFFGGGPGGRGPGGMMPPPFMHRRGPPCLFPECKEFMDAVHQKMRELGGGEPWKRKPANNEDKCNFSEKMEARNKVTLEPTAKCLEQVKQFFTGSKVIATTEGTTTTKKA